MLLPATIHTFFFSYEELSDELISGDSRNTEQIGLASLEIAQEFVSFHLGVCRDVIICFCICSTIRIICFCICIQIEDRKWAWFVLEVTFNLVYVVFSNLIFIGSAIVVPSKHQIELVSAYN